MQAEKELESLRDTLLMLVYLDQWRAYRPWFPVRKVAAATRRFRRLSSLMAWMQREGAAHAN